MKLLRSDCTPLITPAVNLGISMIHFVGTAAGSVVDGLSKYPLIQIARSIERANRFNVAQTGQTGLSATIRAEAPDEKYAIEELIVSSPEHKVVASIAPILRRLGSHSTILLLQSLPGIQSNLEREFWPSRRNRPRFLAGIPPENTGTFLISGESASSPLASKILDSVNPFWMGQWCPQKELQLIQLENLVIRSCIDPLVTLVRSDPWDLASEGYAPLIYQLVKESCKIVQSYYDEPRIEQKRLERLIYERIHRMGLLRSVKRAEDVLYKKNSALSDCINGHLCSIAKSAGVAHKYNSILWDLVSTRALLDRKNRIVQ